MDSFDQEVANMFFSVQQITKKQQRIPGDTPNSQQTHHNHQYQMQQQKHQQQIQGSTKKAQYGSAATPSNPEFIHHQPAPSLTAIGADDQNPNNASRQMPAPHHKHKNSRNTPQQQHVPPPQSIHPQSSHYQQLQPQPQPQQPQAVSSTESYKNLSLRNYHKQQASAEHMRILQVQMLDNNSEEGSLEQHQHLSLQNTASHQNITSSSNPSRVTTEQAFAPNKQHYSNVQQQQMIIYDKTTSVGNNKVSERYAHHRNPSEDQQLATGTSYANIITEPAEQHPKPSYRYQPHYQHHSNNEFQNLTPTQNAASEEKQNFQQQYHGRGYSFANQNSNRQAQQPGFQQSRTETADHSPAVYHRAHSSCSLNGGAQNNTNNTSATRKGLPNANSTGQQFKRKSGAIMPTQSTSNQAQNSVAAQQHNSNNALFQPILRTTSDGGIQISPAKASERGHVSASQFQQPPRVQLMVSPSQQMVDHHGIQQDRNRHGQQQYTSSNGHMHVSNTLTRARSAGKPFNHPMTTTTSAQQAVAQHHLGQASSSSNLSKVKQMNANVQSSKDHRKKPSHHKQQQHSTRTGSLTQRAKSSSTVASGVRVKTTSAPGQQAQSQPKGEMLLKTDLTGHKLLSVPNELSPDLAWLVLDENAISQIGTRTLPPALQHLSMERNQLSSIYTAELDEVRQTLKTLNLRGNKLQSVQAISVCTMLKDLNLSSNMLSDVMVTSTIPGLKKLRRLDISANQLQNGFKLMDSLHSLKGLKILKISDNSMVSQLRLDVGRHFRLRELYGDSNKFQSLIIERSHVPKSQESQMRMLSLSCNHIGKYEGHIQGLQHLGNSLLDLNLSQNFLDQISFIEGHRNSFFGLNQLRSLTLANNQIRTVYWNASQTKNVSLKVLDISYNKLEDINFVKVFEGLAVLKAQANPFEMCSETLDALASLRHMKDLSIEVSKLSTSHLKQASRIKRINGVPSQNVYKDLMEREGRGNAVVGGGAGSGLGPGHMATTLTSFNVSAIANPLSLESPHMMNNLLEHQEDDQDINAQEKHEIYQQVIQLETNHEDKKDNDDDQHNIITIAATESSPLKQGGFNTHAASAYGQQTSACFGEVASTSKAKDRKTHGLNQDEFFTLSLEQQKSGQHNQQIVDLLSLQQKLKNLENDFRRTVSVGDSHQMVFEQVVGLFQNTLDSFKDDVANNNHAEAGVALTGKQQSVAMYMPLQRGDSGTSQYTQNDYSTVGQIEPAAHTTPAITKDNNNSTSPYLDSHHANHHHNHHQSPMLIASSPYLAANSLSDHTQTTTHGNNGSYQEKMNTGTIAAQNTMTTTNANLVSNILSASQECQLTTNTSQQLLQSKALQQSPHLYLPVKQDQKMANHAAIVKSSSAQSINADMLIHSFRPFLAELLNIISYMQLKVAEKEKLNNNDLLYNVLSKVSQSLQLLIAPARLEQLINENQNQGMYYAVRSKPESLLYYPVFKLILQQGWTGMPTDQFKELILSQIQTIQSKIAEEQGLTAESNQKKQSQSQLTQQQLMYGGSSDLDRKTSTMKFTNDNRHQSIDSDMPLASKETLQLDSHRPLTYETQHLRQTNYNIKTPNLEDFVTRENNDNSSADQQMLLDEREDRIRTIQASDTDDFTTGGKLLKSPLAAAEYQSHTSNQMVPRHIKTSECGRQPRQQQSQNGANVKDAQLRALYQELVQCAIQPVPQDLLTESQNSATPQENKLIFERILSTHADYKVLRQIFRMCSHSKMLSIYKRHDPQTQLLLNSADSLTIGWIGCVSEMKDIALAFEELRTDGLKVTKSVDDVVNFVLSDPLLLASCQKETGNTTNGDTSNIDTTQNSGKKNMTNTNKAQWRVVANLVSERFESGSTPQQSVQTAQTTKQRLVHPCYIIDFQFKIPQQQQTQQLQ